MSFGQALSSVFSKYAVFTGRATRSEYWWFVLFQVLIGIVIGIISAFAQNSGAVAVSVLSAIVSLALILPNLAVLVRRLHDANYAGWFVFLVFVPFVGSIILLVFALLPSNPLGARFNGPAVAAPPIGAPFKPSH